MTPQPSQNPHPRTFEAARHAYADLGVDADAAVTRALAIPVSIHCWQGDDVAGFEVVKGAVDSGGILATGNYPGRARNADQLRQDLDQVLTLVPGTHRANLHAIYAETAAKPVPRDELRPDHFDAWIDWARERGIALDFNPTYFAHPMAADGLTLAHPDRAVRDFWVRHGIACRRIAEHMSRRLDSPCGLNHWLPDGAKDSPADRWAPRARLVESLDAVLDPDLGVDAARCVDSVESKLFGLGSEDYVVGSFEFYSAYALSRRIVLCLDMGHFHPTETIHDKLSALLQFHERLLLHLSRPIRWDSDHVVLFNDDLRHVMLELARGKALDRAALALDFFDAGINRVAAYVIGARAARKALLYALLDPADTLRHLETHGRGAEKLALMETVKTRPFGAVWDEACRRADTPPDAEWIHDVQRYEKDVLSKRN